MAAEIEIRTGKRKRGETSGSTSSSFSSPQCKYQLRQTKSPGCIFGGSKSSCNVTSTDSSTSTSREPSASTSTWGPAHYNRLNFNVMHKPYSVPFIDEDEKFNFKDRIQKPLMQFLFRSAGRTKFPPPNIVDDAFLETTWKEISGNDPVISYINDLSEDLESHGFTIKSASKEQKKPLQAYMLGLSIGEGLLPPTIISSIKDLIGQIHNVCAENSLEIEIDEIMKKMLQFIMKEEDLDYKKYHILLRNATRFYFDICGAQVISETNVLLAYTRGIGNSISDIKEEGIPLVLSENKGGIDDKRKATRSTARHRHKLTPAVAHLSQVIGQCLSVADKSPFETDDFKIVYHVSLMGTSDVVVTRTHVAKSTLRVIKDGCGIPNQQELDPSHTFTMSCEISNSPMLCFKVLYIALSYLLKLSQKQIHDPS
ncbi:uncharacterized protein LOC144442798 [Glandiceps talaboti]